MILFDRLFRLVSLSHTSVTNFSLASGKASTSFVGGDSIAAIIALYYGGSLVARLFSTSLNGFLISEKNRPSSSTIVRQIGSGCRCLSRLPPIAAFDVG